MSTKPIRTAIATSIATVLLSGPMAWGQAVQAATPTIGLVPSTAETQPVQTTGDSADDPAIWVHPTDRALSLVLVNNKRGSLETYDLDGHLVQRLQDEVTFWGNVDVRSDVTIGNFSGDLVAVSHRGLSFYTIDPTTRLLSSAIDSNFPGTSGEGVCLYQNQTTGTTYAINITIAGRLRQYELTDPDGDGLINGRLVRDLQVGSEAEGCVAHDDAGSLYVSQEDVALWRYGAAPWTGTARAIVDRVVGDGGELEPDIEGVALAETSEGNILFASAQRVARAYESYFIAYTIETDGTWPRYRAFRISRGTNSDDCDRTDGIAVYAGDLGASYPHGLFVCQDNSNSEPGTVGNQDLKFVRLESVLPFLAG